jgi:dUTP pyrophosphatase
MKAHIIENSTNPHIEEILESNKLMESVFDNLNEDEDGGFKAIAAALALPEKEFAFVSEELLRGAERSVNNPEDKLVLVQALNAQGLKAEDLIAKFTELCDNIDEEFKDTLSQQKKDFLKSYMMIVCNAVTETDGIAKRILQVKIELAHPDAKIPTYAKVGDAGMDVYAVEDITINPGETVIVPTGIKVALPLGYEFEVRPRSGLSAKTPLRIANAPGTIDSGYRDEIGVIVTNIEPKIKDLIFHNDGTIDQRGILYGQSYTITKGMRFAQLVLKEVPTCSFVQVESVHDIGENRNGGFGSSGVN